MDSGSMVRKLLRQLADGIIFRCGGRRFFSSCSFLCRPYLAIYVIVNGGQLVEKIIVLRSNNTVFREQR